MNPWGLVILALGVLLIIIGVKGSYSNVIGALKSTGSSGGAVGGNAIPPGGVGGGIGPALR